jgi:hypothetical protein
MIRIDSKKKNQVGGMYENAVVEGGPKEGVVGEGVGLPTCGRE